MLEIQSFDDRRDIAIPGNLEKTIQFAVEHWIQTAQESIQQRSRFAVALSGGSTPAAIYRALAHPQNSKRVDWSKVYLFWSDERTVPPDHPNSNYHMAMQSGFSRLPLIPTQIFRMKGEEEILGAADEYEGIIRKILGPSLFDLVMLGVGEDGHTASLFPNTTALQAQERLVVANHIPEIGAWRITLTMACINQSWRTAIYAMGAAKQNIVVNALSAPRHSAWPVTQVGTVDRKALWIVDKTAAQLLNR